MTAILWTAVSSNKKTGPIPVSTTSRETCSPSCPLKDGGGCYAESGGLSWMWNGLSAAGENAAFKSGRATLQSTDWDGLVRNVDALPDGQLWRHNQAGDLPHANGTICNADVEALTAANSGKRGFTYTHHNVDLPANATVVQNANAGGFTVNLSANNLAHADELAAKAIGPVVVVLPASVQGNVKLETPDGRKVVVCPATYRDDVNCKSCGLCQKQRDTIVGFPAHGARKGRIAA